MLKLSEAEILKRIDAGELFECTADDEAFTLKVEDYTPAIFTAIHAGHQMRQASAKHCALDESERLCEEAPYTCQLIDSMPITLIAGDSRYEYDLNSPLATCIDKKNQGKKVWLSALPAGARKHSIERHQRFYRILDALVAKVEQRYGACVVFDVQAFNYLAYERDMPTFHVGTEQLDQERWSKSINHFQQCLTRVDLGGTPVSASCNEDFGGRGYLIAHINSRFQNTLVLPLEVKKVFMDELKGELYPLVLQHLKQELKRCFTDTAAFFSRRHTRKQRAKRVDMLSSQVDPSIKHIDKALYSLAKGLETLVYINPTNIAEEKKRFFSRHGKYRPVFRYRPLNIDPYLFREKLYRLPLDQIRDPSIQQMYRQVIDDLSSKIDLLVSAGQPGFVYNSLQYYGEPSINDEKNAAFLLHANEFEVASEKTVDAQEMLRRFREHAEYLGMPCRIELSGRMVAAAMVLNSKKMVYVNKDVSLSEAEAKALLHHELGVHMATTLNASRQSLKVFSLGMPGNTMTQEGLAILNEFHSGNVSLSRLKELALRVVAVREMLNHGDFSHTFSYLVDEHKIETERAFKLAVRVHRGGGFSKDYLYLRGVAMALDLHQKQDLSNLYIGKTGFEFLPIVNEMVSRGLVQAPVFVPEFLHKPEPVESVLSYLMHSIRAPADTV
jgi:uncharacterized protein (TIGR02421 family)